MGAGVRGPGVMCSQKKCAAGDCPVEGAAYLSQLCLCNVVCGCVGQPDTISRVLGLCCCCRDAFSPTRCQPCWLKTVWCVCLWLPRYSLAPARGYVESIHQLYAMRDAGLVKAGAENLFNIAYGDRW